MVALETARRGLRRTEVLSESNSSATRTKKHLFFPSSIFRSSLRAEIEHICGRRSPRSGPSGERRRKRREKQGPRTAKPWPGSWLAFGSVGFGRANEPSVSARAKDAAPCPRTGSLPESGQARQARARTDLGSELAVTVARQQSVRLMYAIPTRLSYSRLQFLIHVHSVIIFRMR